MSLRAEGNREEKKEHEDYMMNGKKGEMNKEKREDEREERERK